MLTQAQRNLIRSLRHHTTLSLDDIAKEFAKFAKTSRSSIAAELAAFGRPRVRKKKTTTSKLVTAPDGKRTYQTATAASVVVQIISDGSEEAYVYGWHRTGEYLVFFQKLGSRRFDYRHLERKLRSLNLDYVEIPFVIDKQGVLKNVPMLDLEIAFKDYASWAMPKLPTSLGIPITSIIKPTTYRRSTDGGKSASLTEHFLTALGS